jgi:hypothetical protein
MSEDDNNTGRRNVLVGRYFAYLTATLLCAALLAGPALAGAGGGCGTGSTSLPEPASLALLAAGVAGLLVLRHRRRK